MQAQSENLQAAISREGFLFETGRAQVSCNWWKLSSDFRLLLSCLNSKLQLGHMARHTYLYADVSSSAAPTDTDNDFILMVYKALN